MDRYGEAARYADRIEQELRALNAWQTQAPPQEAFESHTAFFADTMSFYQWLQFVLTPKVRAIVEQRGSFPARSQVGAYAVRELDGLDKAGGLIEVLSDFDQFIERG
ncbi:MAG: pseudouridine synthase [Acidobacteria bacterium]|nr:MAG: pseudouridine synthase [Acidobacteriota bacterium]